MPDMLYFDTEMRKPGVTRQLLWMEYKAQATTRWDTRTSAVATGNGKKTRRLSMRQEHRAGEKLFIDFCGPTVPLRGPQGKPEYTLNHQSPHPRFTILYHWRRHIANSGTVEGHINNLFFDSRFTGLVTVNPLPPYFN